MHRFYLYIFLITGLKSTEWLAKLKPENSNTECDAVWLSENILITSKNCLKTQHFENLKILTGRGTYLTTVGKTSLIYPPKNLALLSKISSARHRIEKLKASIRFVENQGLVVQNDFNRTELVIQILNELEESIEPDFLLVNTNQDVVGEAYSWNQDVLSVFDYKNESLSIFGHETVDCRKFDIDSLVYI